MERFLINKEKKLNGDSPKNDSKSTPPVNGDQKKQTKVSKDVNGDQKKQTNVSKDVNADQKKQKNVSKDVTTKKPAPSRNFLKSWAMAGP